MRILIIMFLSIVLFSSCEDEVEQCEACQLIPQVGMCNAAIPKYYYDQDSSACRMFIWGGCGGVVPFETLEECKSCCEE